MNYKELSDRLHNEVLSKSKEDLKAFVLNAEPTALGVFMSDQSAKFKLQWGDIIDVGAFDGLTVIDYDDKHVKCDMDGHEDESGLFLIDDIDGFSRSGKLQVYNNGCDDWSVYVSTACGDLECKVSAPSFTECMRKFEDGGYEYVSG